ncbi:unnamed protein product [Protopolystoma xenopodis]|uniref:Uncharacterized protein n=1 Tax=Protopolystoma xenopodis TaxID=117903 RepID=A0A3S5C0G3_9PLAT|nr:unnamed protein product [Protopolystoma xenopodis]
MLHQKAREPIPTGMFSKLAVDIEQETLLVSFDCTHDKSDEHVVRLTRQQEAGQLDYHKSTFSCEVALIRSTCIWPHYSNLIE